jgi:predicted dehydrogenase
MQLMNLKPVSRRAFLRTSRNTLVGVSVGAALPSIFLNHTRAQSGTNPSDFIRLGFIGVGKQGTGNLSAFMNNAVAVCDVDQTHLAAAKKKVESAVPGRACATYSDYQKVLAAPDIDAVVISTPDHWHTLPAIHACQAGKDVYCEKPLTLSIGEGIALVKAVRDHKRILQTGSQQRSETKFRHGCELVRDGYIGKIKEVMVGLPGVNWLAAPPVPDSAPPAELDYNFWLGPAPQRPYNEQHVHYYFRFFWDYSGGQMTNWGAHHLDIAQWGLGMDDSGPVTIQGSAKYDPQKRFETPVSFKATYTYANGVKVTCESPAKITGTTFIGSKGQIRVNRGVLESEPEDLASAQLKDTDPRLYVSNEHHKNWLDCIKSRKLPICDVEIGHRSATVCHLGNIAIRTGKKIKWDPVKQQIVGNSELAGWVNRPYRAPWKLPA